VNINLFPEAVGAFWWGFLDELFVVADVTRPRRLFCERSAYDLCAMAEKIFAATCPTRNCKDTTSERGLYASSARIARITKLGCCSSTNISKILHYSVLRHGKSYNETGACEKYEREDGHTCGRDVKQF